MKLFMRGIWLSAILVSCTSLDARVVLLDRMIEAVRAYNMPQLRKLMKKFDRERLSSEDKKRSLEVLRAAALDVLVLKKNPSLLEDARDTLSVAAGGLLSVLGISYMVGYATQVRGVPRTIDQTVTVGKAVASGMVSLFGAYKVVQGCAKASQIRAYEKTRKIDEYLESCIQEIDIPTKN